MRPDARRLADLVVALLVLTAVAFSSRTEWLVAAPQAPVRAAATDSASTLRPRTRPAGVRAAATSSTQVDVTWTAATNENGVTGYEVYRDGQRLATVGDVTSFVDVTVQPGSSYSYSVRARDAAREWSAFSNPALVSTSPGTSQGMIFADDFELGSFSNWTTRGSAGNWTFESTRVHGGKLAAQAATTAGGAYAKTVLPATYANGYFRAYIYLASSSGQVNVMRYRSAADASLGYLYLTANGLLGLRNDAGKANLRSTTAASFDAWHRLEFHLHVNGSVSATEVRLDGAKVPGLSVTGNWGTTPIGMVQIGEVHAAGSWNITYDDVAFATMPIGP